MNQTNKLFGLPPSMGRFVFVIAGFCINMAMGSNFSWSVFRKPLEDHFGCNSTASGLPFTLFMVFFVTSMLIASKFIERIGPRKIISTGGIIIGLGWFLSGCAPNITILSFTYGIIAGSGVGIVYGCPIAISSKWFPDKKGLAVGLTLAGYGLSAVVTGPFAGYLIAINGPFFAMKVMGTVIFTVIVISSLVMRFPEQDCFMTNKIDLKNNGIDIELQPNLLFRRSTFLGLYLCYFLSSLSGPMAIGISSPVGQEIIGLSAAQAAQLVAVFALFNGAGRPLFGYLSDALTPRWTSTLSFIIILLASIGMLTAGQGDIAIYVICFAAFWLTMGGWIAIAPASTTTFFGRKHQVKNYGLIFTAYGTGGTIGILLSGLIKDHFGTYRYAFIPTTGMALIGIILSIIFLKNKKENPLSH